MQVSGQWAVGMEGTKFWVLILSGGYLLGAVKVASSIFINPLNATKLKSSKTQFHIQFELSLAQLSHSLFYFLSHIFVVPTPTGK